jgi:Helicase HerA, central domain
LIDIPNKLYLGREFDRAAQSVTDDPVLINARDLTTHAVCLGMTGTGKTGLGIVALEEALLQGIPCIIIDPKGDITNLALNFPDLASERFAAWLDEDEAARLGVTREQHASNTAARWRDGLAHWGIGTERLQALHDRVKFEVFTPGSDAGIPVNVLQGLNPPSDPNITWSRNGEALRERIAQVVGALLELAGIEADPMKSREHILLSTIFESTWRAAQPLSIETLIQMIQQPPVQRVGAFDMEVFYPRTDRFELAMALNNLVASPSFASWTHGATLDIPTLLRPDRDSGGVNPIGRTRACIFYLAHLGDAERQFFVTLLLSQLVMWMRAQTGTSQLRCLVYFDEVFGYCPPFPRNPPTKAPLMTIIKQGRAAGLGTFLATQNPADLDYKGLSNIGTWFIGRLRTGRDRDRALEGLEGAGAGFDREHYEDALSTLPSRVFLLQSASGNPRLFQTRWAMSYLRGPLTRDQVGVLAEADRDRYVGAPSPAPAPQRLSRAPEPPSPASDAPFMTPPPAVSRPPVRPSVPPDVREVFLNIGRATAYRPHLIASAAVRITDRSSGTISDQRYTYLVPLDRNALAPDLGRAERVELETTLLSPTPEPGMAFDGVPPGITARWMKQADRQVVEHIYRFAIKRVLYNRPLRMYSQLDEPSIDFRQRLEAAAREKRDADALKLRAQFERRMKSLQDKLAREHRELSQDKTELGARKREELLAGVEAVFNFVIGKRSPHAVAFGAQRRRQVQVSQEDMRETERAIARLNADLESLADEYRAALNAVSDKWVRVLGDVQEVPLAPRKGDIFADLVALAWVA